MDIIDNSNISSEHLNGSGVHPSRHEKGKLTTNLIKNLREFCRNNSNKNCGQSRQSLAPAQHYAFNCVCNNGCKINLDTADLKHLLEIEHDFQNTGNQVNVFHETRIKNANRLITGHLNINCLH